MKKINYLYLFSLFVFLLLDFALQGGKFQISSWYISIILFFKAILFGGIEEIGWRNTFQLILEEKFNYILSTIITFVSWGIWHLLYFYVSLFYKMIIIIIAIVVSHRAKSRA